MSVRSHAAAPVPVVLVAVGWGRVTGYVADGEGGVVAVGTGVDVDVAVGTDVDVAVG